MIDRQYEDLPTRIMEEGVFKGDRIGTGTRSLFGAQLHYDLSRGSPLVTTKRVYLKSIIGELFWFLSGDSDIAWSQKNGVRIWNGWADENGDLSPVYGPQWRKWRGADGHRIDQISQTLDTLKTDPDSRRMLVSARNVGEPDKMALEPYHALLQLYVAEGRFSLQLYQCNTDMFLRVPLNIVSYSLFTHMFAQQAGLEVGDSIWTGGDYHVYSNHVEQVTEQLSHELFPFPNLGPKEASSMLLYDFNDVLAEGYEHHPAIKAPVAV